jgi:hypothetical protein
MEFRPLSLQLLVEGIAVIILCPLSQPAVLAVLFASNNHCLVFFVLVQSYSILFSAKSIESWTCISNDRADNIFKDLYSFPTSYLFSNSFQITSLEVRGY